MKTPIRRKGSGGLYVLGSLYPQVTGGMEIFNYYFLNQQLQKNRGSIFYLGEKSTGNQNGALVSFKKRRPTRFFYPFQFFFAVWKLRKMLDYAYISYAEQSWLICYATSLTLRFFNIPYIITIHWGKEPDWRFSYPFVSYFRHAHAVIGVSEPICSAFKKVIPGKEFQYIPPLIPFVRNPGTRSASKNKLGYQNEEKILLFVGSLKAMKNPDKIIEALRVVGTEFLESQQIRLLFAGKGEMENALTERVERYRLGKYIRFDGLVSREMIPEYYNAADVYIISSDYEGTSVSLLEAMFNRLPIIASDAPGINGMLAHEYNALLYETTDTEHLAETVKRIFSDQVLADGLAENARADFQKKYSYDSMMEKYQTVFSSVNP